MDYNDKWFLALKQCLELIMSSFVVVNKQMFVDQLKGGIHDKCDDSFVAETASVQTTNVGPERNFGMLDNLMMLKPKATTTVPARFEINF